MRSCSHVLLTLLALLGPLVAVTAAPPEARELAVAIDRHLGAAWKAAGVTPAGPADDAEFLRRVSLDLGGRIPSVAETRAFLGNRRPDARARLIDELLASPRYAAHFTDVWRSAWVPEVDNDPESNFFVRDSFSNWLHGHLRKNTGYDQVVRELLTFPVPDQTQMQNFFNNRSRPSPLGYYVVKKYQAEELASGAARQFFGIRLECAQCHNHPFADWKREQFWSFASFFAGVKRASKEGFPIAEKERFERRELAIPGTDRVVQAVFLDGSEPRWKYKVAARVTLAEWTTRADNPYFARATVNRLWAYLFGVGLVEPFDEMVGGTARDSHPELLDELARNFAAHQFDLKYLLRAIALSRAYQLSSAGSATEAPESHLFARMTVRGLTPVQLYDSVAQAIGVPNVSGAGSNPFNNTPRSRFLSRFANTGDRAIDVQMSILQALTLMNGDFVKEATSAERGRTLAAVLDAPFLDTTSRLDTVYLAALSRLPRPAERSRMLHHLEAAALAGQAPAERRQRYDQAFTDVFWVLLNSGEFVLNR
jgi:hypothetical protein